LPSWDIQETQTEQVPWVEAVSTRESSRGEEVMFSELAARLGHCRSKPASPKSPWLVDAKLETGDG